MKNKTSIKNITICSLFCALIAVGAFIRIPLPAIPITLQTFFVSLAGLILGKKRAAISCSLYVILGLLGLPIFTQGGGFSYVFNPTFGYLIGFIVGAYVIGLITDVPSPSNVRMLIGAFSSMLIIYLFGTVYYYILSVFYMGKTVAILPMLTACVFVSLPGDIVTNILAVFLAKRLKRHIS